jgi:two-component system LytT family response regulator
LPLGRGVALSRPLRVHLAEAVPASRARLLSSLRDAQQVSITGVSTACDQARAILAVHEPDVILLDARLPGADRFALAVERRGELPLVIVLADDNQDATAAFEVGAIDFLRRPVSERRLVAALGRARASIELHADARLGRQFRAAAGRPNGANGSSDVPDRLVASSGGRTVSVNVGSIDWIEAEGNYVRVHAGADTLLLRSNMATLAAQLRAAGFVRIHRSRLVNLASVQEIHARSDGGGTLIMADGTHVRFSRSARERLVPPRQ